jgi:hypothetical protein
LHYGLHATCHHNFSFFPPFVHEISSNVNFGIGSGLGKPMMESFP